MTAEKVIMASCTRLMISPSTLCNEPEAWAPQTKIEIVVRGLFQTQLGTCLVVGALNLSASEKPLLEDGTCNQIGLLTYDKVQYIINVLTDPNIRSGRGHSIGHPRLVSKKALEMQKVLTESLSGLRCFLVAHCWTGQGRLKVKITFIH